MSPQRSVMTALSFAYIAFALIGGLNLLPAIQGRYHPVHLIYTGLLVVSVIPMLVFLAAPRERLPFFQMICLLYGVHYALFPFFGLRAWYHYDYLSHDDLVFTATLAFFGVVILVAGYYMRPINLVLRFIRPPRIDWDARHAKTIAIAFMAIGLVAIAMLKTGRVFEGGGQVIVFGTRFAVIGVLAFYLLQMRGQLGLSATAILWLVYVPIFILIAISGGNSGPIGLFAISVIMLYIAEKRKIPWLVILAGICVLFPFMWAKFEYRTLVWDASGAANFADFGDAMKNVATFAALAGKFATGMDNSDMGFALHAIAIRFDISYLFAHVATLTPAEVGYLNGESYADVAWKVIPRLILPDKPDPSYGQVFGHMYSILAVDDLTTSINFPQMVEMYVNFGVPGVLIGMFIMSQIYWFLSYMMNQPGMGDWLTVFANSIFTGLFLIETNFSLVVGGIFYNVILLYVIGFFIRRQPSR